jgi:hypothetical protein
MANGSFSDAKGESSDGCFKARSDCAVRELLVLLSLLDA